MGKVAQTVLSAPAEWVGPSRSLVSWWSLCGLYSVCRTPYCYQSASLPWRTTSDNPVGNHQNLYRRTPKPSRFGTCPLKKKIKISTHFRWTGAWWLTCREHLLVEARGSDRYIKVSNVRDLRWQVRHCTVDLNWPWNSATMMDSFNSLCLLQATSAAVWSSRWSFSSSLCCFRFSTCQQRDRNVIYNHIVVKSQRMLTRKN